MKDRTSAIRTYLFDIIKEFNKNYKQININFLSDDINNYSLDKIGTKSITQQWIAMGTIRKDVYSFRSRMSYSADVINNIENAGFYESFENKIYTNNIKGILPKIKGIESIECLNCGSMTNAGTNTCEFDIQIQITYYVEEEL